MLETPKYTWLKLPIRIMIYIFNFCFALSYIFLLPYSSALAKGHRHLRNSLCNMKLLWQKLFFTIYDLIGTLTAAYFYFQFLITFWISISKIIICLTKWKLLYVL